MKRRDPKISLERRSDSGGGRTVVGVPGARHPVPRLTSREPLKQHSRKQISKERLSPEPILDRDATADFWRNIGIPKSRDIRLLVPGTLPRNKRFETLQDVADRKIKLIDALQDLNPVLAEAYENCSPDARCSIPGCPHCSRRYRGYLFSETARINELPIPGPRFFVTVYLATIPEHELTHVRIFDAHKALRKRMERIGFRGVLIGGTEAAWDAKRQVWILHLHILSIGVSGAAWDRLAKSMADTDRAIPIKVEQLKDLIRPLSYMQKWVTYFRPRRRVGHQPSKPVPLKPPQVAELCRWWACHRFENFMFLYGAKRHGGRIVPNVRLAEVGPVGPVGTPRVLFSTTYSVESIYQGRTIRFTVRDEIAVANQLTAFGDGANYTKKVLLPTVPTRPTKHTNARTK